MAEDNSGMSKANFKLPESFYLNTVTDLVAKTLPQMLGRLEPETAWRYVYAIAMYSQSHEGKEYLHLQESDKLGTTRGREFAERGAQYLRTRLAAGGDCNPFEVVDQLGRARNAEVVSQGLPEPKRRDQNVTGAAFETALQVVIGRLTGSTAYRTPSLRSLQGFELAPVGYHSKPDLVLFGPRDFRLLISTKWTLRKERIGTYLHEAYFYKQRRPDLQVAFVVNEFQPNILKWLSQDPLADKVYHVNKDMLLHLYDPFRDLPDGHGVPREALMGQGRTAKAYRQWIQLSDRISDLSELFSDIQRLQSKADQKPDPGDVEEADDDDDAI